MKCLFMRVICLAGALSASNAYADAEVGKAKVQQLCAECHRPADWNGETQPALQALIRDVVAGKIPHRKRALQLSEQDIVDIAAYWTSGRK